MGKKIGFNYEGKNYKLEYNRESIKLMEKQGFSVDKFVDQPFTMVELAFEGAFIMHHPKMTKAEANKIYQLFENKKELVNGLISMIQETYSSLFEESNDDESKKIEWKMD